MCPDDTSPPEPQVLNPRKGLWGEPARATEEKYVLSHWGDWKKVPFVLPLGTPRRDPAARRPVTGSPLTPRH